MARSTGMGDYPDFTPAAALVTSSRTITQGGINQLAVGASTDIGPFPIDQIGYELWISCQNHTQAALPSDLFVSLHWTDTATGTLLGNEGWDFAAGPPGTPQIVTGHGPSTADSLIVKFVNNPGGGDAVDVSYVFLQNNRMYAYSDVRTRVLAGAGYMLGSPGEPQGILFNSSPAPIASGANWSRLLPLYVGQAEFQFRTSSGAADAEFTLNGIGTWTLANYTTEYDQFTDSNGLLNVRWALNGLQSTVTATNRNANPQTLSGMGFFNSIRP
jgi:hypothetical protein